MRVRPLRHVESRPRTAPGPRRGLHVVAAPVEIEHPAEERVRHAGGPNDRAFYTCSCGFAFDAAVSTSVTCPHCGTGQAW